MSNFDFLTTEWKDIHEAASKAESATIPDPPRRRLVNLSSQSGQPAKGGVPVEIPSKAAKTGIHAISQRTINLTFTSNSTHS